VSEAGGWPGAVRFRCLPEPGRRRNGAGRPVRRGGGTSSVRRALERRRARRIRRHAFPAAQGFLPSSRGGGIPGAAPQTDVPFVGALPYEEFLGRLAERTGLDRDQARLAAEAVLEALAIRLSAGEIDDIEPSIPPELRPALVRGRVRGGTRANPLPFEEFIDMIARREGVTSAQATEHARAVLAVLREAVGEKEFRDMKEQLPASYRVLFAQNTSSV
jgi:uncharacterized protein (DUF2267 family)